MESKLDQLATAVEQAEQLTEKIRALADFLDECDTCLRGPDPQLRYSPFHAISHFFGQPDLECVLWNWLQEKARGADIERQINMRIGILELVPDPPIRWSSVFRLWDLWFDTAARWCVYAAYVPFPRRLKQHWKRYCAHRRRHGLEVPELRVAEFVETLVRHEAKHIPQAMLDAR